MDEYDVGKAIAAVEEELTASLIRNLERHQVQEIAEGMEWEMWQAEQMRALRKYRKKNKEKFVGKFAEINSNIEEIIRKARKNGNTYQDMEILNAFRKGWKSHKKQGATVDTMAEFFKVNDKKLNALIKATTDDFKRAETAILRMAEDQYRQIIFNSHVYANTGSGTYKKAVDMATKDFLSRGINCIEYVNGARHTMSDYADMAIRTASKRAYLTGEGEKRHEWGISTVIMNKRGNPCPKCLLFVGKVLIDDVWSGGSAKDGPYPLMSKAMTAGLYHPRCKDSHTTYIENISDPPDDVFTREEINAIEQGNRHELQRQYAQRQADKFKRLADYSLDDENQEKYKRKAQEWEKQVENVKESDILKVDEKLYRKKGYSHRKISESENQIIDKATFNKITHKAKRNGANIQSADDEWKKHLIENKATAVTVGDTIIFTEDVTVSDVLEETHHFMQNIKGINKDKNIKVRTILNEIDAKEYVLLQTDKYNIPEKEVKLTKNQLESYKDQMEKMKGRGEWDD